MKRKYQIAFPKEGTLHYLFVEKTAKAGKKGVTFLDFVGTGITEQNIDSIAQDLANGMYESDDPEHMAAYNEIKAIMAKGKMPHEPLQ
jgi:hypothetical protein